MTTLKTIRPTQQEMVLDYLKQGLELSPLKALNMFGCFRLGAIIHTLRREGYNITTKINPKGKKYAIYKLVDTP